LKVVQELGEDTFAESKQPSDDQAVTSAASSTAIPSQPANPIEGTTETASDEATSPIVESHETSTQDPLRTPTNSVQHDEVPATTIEREPMKVPDSVHVRITSDNLKEYVGPPVYQKDRMYAKPPPPGVSTGLGYLGNGSGAVMPIEAMVRSS